LVTVHFAKACALKLALRDSKIGKVRVYLLAIIHSIIILFQKKKKKTHPLKGINNEAVILDAMQLLQIEYLNNVHINDVDMTLSWI
jgi:hypothetical protein